MSSDIGSSSNSSSSNSSAHINKKSKRRSRIRMSNLSHTSIVLIGLAASVSILIIGIGIAIGITNKNNASRRSVKYVRPPVDPTNGKPVPADSIVCGPLTQKYKGLVKCTKQSSCTGCIESDSGGDGGVAYECVAITGGNNFIDGNGKLAHPTTIPFPVPFSVNECSGHGSKNAATLSCTCEPGFSGNNCEVYNLEIDTPGSYCLPAYANKCNPSTSDIVLTNPDTGTGGEWTCDCKSMYKDMYAQEVEGGSCDLPLICGASSPQMDAQETSPVLYSVYAGTDENNNPIFKPEPVFTNRVTSFNTFSTEPCILASTGLTEYPHTGGVPYKVSTVDPMADPTCKGNTFSNHCVATVFYGDSGSVNINIRGSNNPGDPLITRASPQFFPPVPPILQRCPYGHTGSNTYSDPCVCACDSTMETDCWCTKGETLQLLATKKCHCNDPMPIKPDIHEEFDSTWYSSVFDDDKEWNGAFTCVADLVTAKARSGPNGAERMVSDIKWTTVTPQTGIETAAEVECRTLSTAPTWLTRASYDKTTQEFSNNPDCVGDRCQGLRGVKRLEWDGTRDGPLVDENNNDLPWFATNGGPLYGGQCSCDGVTYRGQSVNSKQVKLIPDYLNPTSGEAGWWKCTQDTCWSAETPGAHLFIGDESTVADMRYPKCVCNVNLPEQTPGKYSTKITYRPEGRFPACVSDPCNPGGFKTTTQIQCKQDSDCTASVCYNKKCYLPPSGRACKEGDDEFCRQNEQGASVNGICASVKNSSTGESSWQCLYEDPERASINSACVVDSDCSYGKCTGLEPAGDGSGDSVGICSGGCVCTPEFIQQTNNANPLGVVCMDRCLVQPCFNNGTCSIDKNGNRVCKCTGCHTGDSCEISGKGVLINEECDKHAKFGDALYCCEGTCENHSWVDSSGVDHDKWICTDKKK